MFLENTVALPPGSLFLQLDASDTSVVMEAPFELPQISQATIEQVVISEADLEIVMSTQEVLDMLEKLCTQWVAAPKQIDDTLEVNIHHLCESHPNTSERVSDSCYRIPFSAFIRYRCLVYYFCVNIFSVFFSLRQTIFLIL